MSTETISVAVFLIVVFGLVTWARERSQSRAGDAYERVFAALLEENKELRDRWYISKGLPVSGVDVKRQAEEKQAARAERRGEALTVGPKAGPLKAMQLSLAAAAAQRRGRGPQESGAQSDSSDVE